MTALKIAEMIAPLWSFLLVSSMLLASGQAFLTAPVPGTLPAVDLPSIIRRSSVDRATASFPSKPM
jgi:hypothetical protein